MANYQTLDYLLDLTSSSKSSARMLNFEPYTSSGLDWDVAAQIYGTDQYALNHSLYKFSALEGATYSISSTSFYDPYLLRLYDSFGNAIVANDELDDPASFIVDGAFYNMDFIYNWVAPYSGDYYVEASWNQGSYYTFYHLGLYGDLDTAKRNFAYGSGNDVIRSTALNETINGGDGIDTVIYSGVRSEYMLNAIDGIVTDKNFNRDGQDRLFDIERLSFSDKHVAIDIEKWDHAGSAFRLYKAAFDRLPDEAGLGYWIDKLDDGASLQLAASGFLKSAEFRSLYGENPSYTQYLTKLYNNVLDRDPDQGGLDYWINQFNSGLSRESALINFSESNENINNTIMSINTGIQYQEWLG